MAEYTTAVDIDAPPEVVFEHLVTAEGILAWMGQHAAVSAVPGGGFAVDVNGVPVRGEYRTVQPPHRVVVSWGVAGSADFPPGTSEVEFTLTGKDGGTRLELVHRGLPEQAAPGHAKGWPHFLDRLRLVATGTDPGPDPWAGPAGEVPP